MIDNPTHHHDIDLGLNSKHIHTHMKQTYYQNHDRIKVPSSTKSIQRPEPSNATNLKNLIEYIMQKLNLSPMNGYAINDIKGCF